MVPTTCRGRSASTAARRRAPALTDRCDIFQDLDRGPIFYTWRARIPSGDAHHRAAGDCAFEVSGKRAGQLIEGDGARDDPLEVPGSQVSGDALPDRQPPIAP